MIGFITYYWMGALNDINNAVYTLDENGNSCPINPTLGVAQGNGTYGVVGTYYTCVRSQNIIETPANLTLADPYVVTNLLGVWE